MSGERKPEKYQFEHVKQIAHETTLRSGHHIPLLIAQGSRGALMATPSELPSTPEGRQLLLWRMGFEFSSDGHIGELEEIFYISEAWMSTGEQDNLPVNPPSTDPQRKEILLIASQRADGDQAQIAIFEMVRDDRNELIGLEETELPPDQEDGNAKSVLLERFIAGFQKGRQVRTAQLN